MTENSKIDWTDNTFNPWIGCAKVSPGCDNCYAERDFCLRKKIVEWGPKAERRRTAVSTWKQPLAWNRRSLKTGRREKVFTGSLCDIFDNKAPYGARPDLFALMEATPSLDWIPLTKRIENVDGMIPDHWKTGGWPRHVGFMATVCNQAEADRIVPQLLTLKAKYLIPWIGLSIEPMLGPINLNSITIDGDSELNAIQSVLWEAEISNWRDSSDEEWEAEFEDWYGKPPTLTGPMHQTLDWVIVGGESGPNARPMHPDWARSLRDQCAAADVPFFFKQWGEWIGGGPDHFYASNCRQIHRWGSGVYSAFVGKKVAGHLLDGCEHREFPKCLEAAS